jgi:hypothetical protein
LEIKGRFKKMDKKVLKKRINYLISEVAAGHRLDGWSLKGARRELIKLKKQWKNISTEEN